MSNYIKRFVKRVVRIHGYKILKLNIRNLTYGRVIPTLTYSPWNKDENFREVYESIRINTFVGIYRCYELWSYVEQSKKLQGRA